MRSRDLLDLLALAALWGGSFLFMRIAGPAFGPVALVEVRVALAALLLTMLLVVRGGGAALRTHARSLTVVGVLNSALPFCLLTYGTLAVTGGFAAILNATTPMWTALTGWIWLNERLRRVQWLGLAIGFGGVALLLWGNVDVRADSSHWQVTLGIGAVLLAAASYGVAATYARKTVAGVPPLVVATGSQIAAAVVLLPFAFFAWPTQWPGPGAWASTVALAVACTALAYLLYFRLIARVGAVRAAAVTFLVPVFATTWGAMFLGEAVTLQMLAGGAVVLAGTALALGLVPGTNLRRPPPQPSPASGGGSSAR